MVSARALLLAPLLMVAAAPVAARQDPVRADGWVVIPVDDYRALRAKAFPVDPAPPPPPVDAAVTRIDYDLTLGTGSVTGTAAVTVDVLKEGWVASRSPTGSSWATLASMAGPSRWSTSRPRTCCCPNAAARCSHSTS